MRNLCKKLEIGEKKAEGDSFKELFHDIKKWFLEQHKERQMFLKEDLRTLSKGEDLSSMSDSDYTACVVELFSKAEQMCRLMLSVYSYGPKDDGEGCQLPARYQRECDDSWRDLVIDFHVLIELLQAQLEEHSEGQKINLAAFLPERPLRNGNEHGGKRKICSSAIRCYNVLREMLIFMEPESEQSLPRFSYPVEIACDTQLLMDRLQDFNFEDDNTMLVAEPMHDLPSEALSVLANLPWTVVIDLDGYSNFGGLHAAAQHSKENLQKMTDETVRSLNLDNNFTKWFICGDFANYTYYQPKKPALQEKLIFLFDGKTAFITNKYDRENTVKSYLESLLKRLSEQKRPLHVLYYHSFDSQWKFDDQFLTQCRSIFQEMPFTISVLHSDAPKNWVEQQETYKELYAPDDSPLFAMFCDLESMAHGLIEHQRDLPLLKENSEPFRLPSSDGLKGIGQSLAVNLSEMFDVLYEDAGKVTAEKAEAELAEFYRGGIATWSVLRGDGAVRLLNGTDYQRRLDRIINPLSHKPREQGEKIITISHEPGIGGSTLLRQIGWDLHKDYPVLLVKHYDVQKKEDWAKNLINLYDKLGKGFLLLADDTIDNLDRIKEAILNLDRPCALLISSRKKGHSNGNPIYFSSITRAAEDALGEKFKIYSPLSPKEKQEKSDSYESFIVDANMRRPFMIGLYFIDKDFTGIIPYVERLMDHVKRIGFEDKREAKMLAMLSLCHIYGDIGLPVFFVDRYMGINRKSHYLNSYPHAETVLIKIRKDLNGFDVYKPRHFLISKEMLNQCCQLIYHQNVENCMTDLSKLLIDAVYESYINDENHDVYTFILGRIFVSNSKERDGDEGFSRLIMETASPSARKEILMYLAEKFNKLVQQRDPKTAKNLYHMVAHFYGHLGRLCHAHGYKGGLDNPEEGKAYCSKAVELSELCPPEKPDGQIYHMLGKSMLALFSKKLTYMEEIPNAESYKNLEDELDEIRNIFFKAADYGSEEHALTSLIDLNLTYMEKVKEWKGGLNFNLFSPRQMECLDEVKRLLEIADSREMDSNSRGYFIEGENRYRSQFSKDGDVIQYYVNRLDYLKGRPGVDEDVLNARRGLITARMARHYAEAIEHRGQYTAIKGKELLDLLSDLQEVLGSPYEMNSYRQRIIRSNCYAQWFYLAKMPGAGRSLEAALTYSERWIKLCQDGKHKDPRPYYYHGVCTALYQLEGNNPGNSRPLNEDWNKVVADLGSKDTMRDVLVEGKGLERLLDLRYAEGDISGYMESAADEKRAANMKYDARKPIVLAGELKKLETGYGYIRLKSPRQWYGNDVKFSTRNISVSENQLTKSIQTFAGFSYEGFRAVDRYICVEGDEESIPRLKGTKELHKPSEQVAQKSIKQIKSPQKENIITQSIKTSIPKALSTFIPNSRQTHKVWREDHYEGWLNGTINGISTGVSIDNDIALYDKEIERFGGAQKVLQQLEEKEFLPCVILKEQEGPHYIASIYQTGKMLEDILNPMQTGSKISEQTPSIKSEMTMVKIGESRKVYLNSIDGNTALGAFECKGTNCLVKIPLKTKNERKRAEKALSQKTMIQIRIVSAGDIYTGKLL